MKILDKFSIRDVISFETYVGAIIPQDFNNVTVRAVIHADACDKYGYDVFSLHAQVKRFIPEGVMEDDPLTYDFLVVRTVDGQDRVIGLPWIKVDTIKLHKTNTVTYTVTDIAQEDINIIRDVIARYGYHVSVKML